MSELLYFLALFFFVAGEADACVVADDEAACNGVDGNLLVAKTPLLLVAGEANVDVVLVLIVDTNPFTWIDDTASVMATMTARTFTLIRRVYDDDEHIVCCLYSPASAWR